METVQTNDVAVYALEHKHRAPVKKKKAKMMNKDWTELHKKLCFKLLTL